MELLSAEQVQVEGDKTLSTRIERVRKLNEEESASVKRLNDALEVERREIDASKARTEQFKKDQEEYRISLSKEVGILEKRKRDALEPITEREEAVTKRERVLEEREKETDLQQATLQTRTAEMRTARTDYEARSKQLEIKEQSLIVREAKLAEDRQQFERDSSVREEIIAKERERLRAYFEEEDAKLNKKHGRT